MINMCEALCWNTIKDTCILQQILIVCQVMGTDIENSLLKYRVGYEHLIFMIETFELLIKSCEKFDLLFVHIQLHVHLKSKL